MTLAAWYWLFLVLWVLGGVYYHWRLAPPNNQGWVPYAFDVLTVLMFSLLGLAVFGNPVK